MATKTVLRLDASARTTGSVTRDLTDRIIDRLNPDCVIPRDLAHPLPHIDGDWIAANFTPFADRSPAQVEKLALSDCLVKEITHADTLVIGAPVYNFGVPAALKAWIDLIARPGVTFEYSDAGPVGLLQNKRAIIAMASGGTAIGSKADYASAYLHHVMGFIGITDVELVTADQVMVDADRALAQASDQVQRLAA
ncbi:NAD(P)H-dependent oxidoreductase [Actibacterium sp. 188UL27-1]|nr:NAD(P)H-dependent oxidoreductase [Actibacterium sp. 188UL27-1]MBM7069514.1 NAD(P)H-dependent oxidoreductase [Actibacterium sp. 188UL27-1]